MKHSEQLSQIADILDSLSVSDYGGYINFGFTLSSDYSSGVKYNIYTPIINHNNFYDFEQFKQFLLSLKAGGDYEVRRTVLTEQLNEVSKKKQHWENRMEEIKTKLSTLKG